MTTKTLHTIRFPGETAEYRSARDKLLEAEVALRANTDFMWPMWAIFDTTPTGRGNWSPELTYR